MDEAGRQPLVNAIAEQLVKLREMEVDSILVAAGSEEETPSGWGSEPIVARRLTLLNLLGECSDNVLDNLTQALVIPPGIATKPASKRPGRAETRAGGTIADPASSIFIVHGHARAELYETVRVLERITELKVIILHEQANAGRTILEKFEDHAAAASYAVVLLTPDDTGRARSAEDLRPRGRQNVIFELGFFFGLLGRARVAVLLGENVEKPSDIDGLVYIAYDAAGAWKRSLARELESAGIPVDYRQIP